MALRGTSAVFMLAAVEDGERKRWVARALGGSCLASS